MIDIYEKSGDPSQRLLIRERQPLPDFADAAEWSHVGTRDTVNPELGSILQNQGYAQVGGNAEAPLQTDWEAVFGGSAAPLASTGQGQAGGGPAAEPRAGATASGQDAGTSSGSSQKGENPKRDAPLALGDMVAGPVLAKASAAVRNTAIPGLEALEARVRDRPLQVLGWTLALGFLLGLLP